MTTSKSDPRLHHHFRLRLVPRPFANQTNSAAPKLQWAAQGHVEEPTFNLEFLHRLKAHDPDAEEMFHSHFRVRLRMKLRSWRLSPSDIEDVVQETFLRVIRAVQNDEIRQPESLGGYVSQVCTFVRNERWRSVAHEVQFDPTTFDVADPVINLETLVLRKERRKIVETVLDDLRPRDRNLLRAKLFDQVGTEEMCARFGASSPDHLRLLLHRARKKFADACKARGLDLQTSLDS